MPFCQAESPWYRPAWCSSPVLTEPDGRCLVMVRHTDPETEQRLLLDKLHLHLPEHPPPKIYTSKLAALASTMDPPNP